MRLDARHTVRYRHARQSSATEERIYPDAHYAIRYRHARQATATIERIIPDARYWISAERGWNRHGACWRRRDGGRIVFVNLSRIAVDAVRPRVAADRFRLGPRAKRRCKRYKQDHQFLCHFIVPFKSFSFIRPPHFSKLRLSTCDRTRIWWMAISLSRFNRCGCEIPSLIITALMFSMLEMQMSWLIVA